ncbi:GLIPR1-like protein 1 [Branchiostoma floridae x Branchiostoma japonicum]
MFAICILILFFGAFSELSVEGTDLNPLEKMIVLTAHDEVRREAQASDMEKMDWDMELEKMAKEWATCSRLGTRETNLVGELFGQNIALSPEGDVVGLLQQWMAQQEHYNYHNNTCAENNTCRDYLQMVWAATNRVGCAIAANCETKERKINMLVCYYSPPMERWTKPYRLGESCTKCPTEASFCDKGLCVPCNEIDPEICECKLTCGKPGVGSGTLDRKTCSCMCELGTGPNCDEECANPIWHEDGFDECAYWEGVPGDCDIHREWHVRYCPANCHFGCRTK